MKNTLVFLYVSIFIISSIFSSQGQVDNNYVMLDSEDEYNVQILTSQWEIRAIDLNLVSKLMQDGTGEGTAIEKATYLDSMGYFKGGKILNFVIYSSDVQHGFSINYQNDQNETESLAVPTIRPVPGEDLGEASFISVTLPSEPVTLNAFCHIFCGLGHPDMKFDFVIGNTSTTKNLDFNGGLAVVIGLAGISIVSFGLYNMRSTVQMQGFDLPKKQKSIISDIFKSRTSMYFYVFNQASQEPTDEVHTAIPRDIFEYKFLLHPVRLSMMKLLYENIQLTSIMLKELLDTSWNDIGNHITALKDRGYIRTEHHLHEGARKQFVTIEPLGTQHYKSLVNLLHIFLDTSVVDPLV